MSPSNPLVGLVAAAFLLAPAVAEAGDPQYEVFAVPAEYPYENNDPSTAADDVPASDPDGGRSIAVGPADPIASPFGWHDTDGVPGAEFTITRGNNIHAYLDRDHDNLPDPDGEPDGGADLDFTGALVPLNLLVDEPIAYGSASTVNAFYWNNVLHDVFYRYGFDEAAGNFQVNNYGNGGADGDPIVVEVQDGTGTNGANFAVPPDGASARMILLIWTITSPARDSALASFVSSHEHGHGVSRRMTGGPGNVGCLNNSEQMGEGWSDWFALVLTAHPGDTRTTQRGVGTYLLGQDPAIGVGFRPAPYSTDFALNDFTYADTLTVAEPFDTGFVWATMLWEVYWDLVDALGFNPDLYAPSSSGGNNLALQLVVDALAVQPCLPGFVDGRDAILLADMNLTGGANQCRIWSAFARRGLGVAADQGTSSSNGDNVEAFDVPASCETVVFADGFESGDTSAWSAVTPLL